MARSATRAHGLTRPRASRRRRGRDRHARACGADDVERPGDEHDVVGVGVVERARRRRRPTSGRPRRRRSPSGVAARASSSAGIARGESGAQHDDHESRRRRRRAPRAARDGIAAVAACRRRDALVARRRRTPRRASSAAASAPVGVVRAVEDHAADRGRRPRTARACATRGERRRARRRGRAARPKNASTAASATAALSPWCAPCSGRNTLVVASAPGVRRSSSRPPTASWFVVAAEVDVAPPRPRPPASAVEHVGAAPDRSRRARRWRPA